jgi:multicomponent Na+:H+ antiporter subunit B
VNAITVPERHITDAITDVNFDIRGFDTLGEEFIMFISVMGAALLLRRQGDELEQWPKDTADTRKAPPMSDAVRVFGIALIGPVVVFGIYIVTHGQLTPGGGFQGGVILASALWMVYLAGDYPTQKRVSPQPLVETSEAVGAGGYAVIGAGCMLLGGAFLQNVLPLGQVGSIWSGGTVVPIDLAVGLEVSGGFAVLLMAYLEETLVLRQKQS